jgi:ribonuclease HI
MMVPNAMKKASLITDGSCLGNPGPGGWACILRFGSVKKEIFGYDPNTTNNRMELMAAIQGLLAFTEPCEVEITTDSEYVLRALRSGWSDGNAAIGGRRIIPSATSIFGWSLTN